MIIFPLIYPRSERDTRSRALSDKETFPKGEEIGNTDFNRFVELDEAVLKPVSEVANHSWEPSYGLPKVRK